MSGAGDFGTIRYETSADKVATITLDRPEVMNAFDRQMCHEVREAWRLVKDDPDVNAVVLRAEGDRAFCAGLDTKKPYGQRSEEHTSELQSLLRISYAVFCLKKKTEHEQQ